MLYYRLFLIKFVAVKKSTLLLLLTFSLSGHAVDSIPFGLRLLRPPLDDTLATEKVAASSTQRPLANALSRLRRVEGSLGPYHNDTGRALLDTAELAELVGSTELASELYNRALHNSRVNHGLSGDAQMPVLNRLLSLHLRSGSRVQYESRLAYKFRLMGSGLAPFTKAELAVAAELFDVRLDTLLTLNWNSRERDLLLYYDELVSLKNKICEDELFARAWCEKFRHRLIIFFYALDYKLKPYISDLRLDRNSGSRNGISGERVPRLEALQLRVFHEGEKLLKASVARDGNNIDGLLALADWYWFHKKKVKALDLYRRARVLDPAELFEPKPVPVVPNLKRYAMFQHNIETLSVNLKVDGNGRPLNIKIVNGAERINVWKRLVRRTLFRPILNLDGEPVESPEIKFDLAVIP